jgi:hypothetical protein
MFNRKGLFDISINEKQLEIYRDYVSHCLTRLYRQQKNMSIADCVEPANPRIEIETILPDKPKLSVRSSITSSLIVYGLRMLGLTTFFNTVSAKPNVYFVLPGVPINETANCDFNKWLGCIESFIGNETDTLARFMMAGTTYYNATVSTAANYVGRKVTEATDPLVNILTSMLVYYPDWLNETRKCRSIAADERLDAALFGNTTSIGEQACYYFQAKTMKLGENYMLDYVKDVAKAEAYPEPTPHAKIVMIMFVVSIITAFGLTGGMYYMARQISKFNQYLRSAPSEQDDRFAVVDPDEVKQQSDSDDEEIKHSLSR